MSKIDNTEVIPLADLRPGDVRVYSEDNLIEIASVSYIGASVKIDFVAGGSECYPKHFTPYVRIVRRTK